MFKINALVSKSARLQFEMDWLTFERMTAPLWALVTSTLLTVQLRLSPPSTSKSIHSKSSIQTKISRSSSSNQLGLRSLD
ncbi:hypothetical protein O181_006355 [Austropuccinia psidii MF-1]|uniref:Uncharacterized protein n=1 Tax=Austropuccinia psidii MF-1 TaxID=1389203 RepID=A0A9Q3BK93_9BASI|nr:hypothetical protein [Austropuccinia psidii MF-1]